MRTLGVAPSLLRRTPRNVYALGLSGLHALPDRFVVGSPHFVLLLAADFESSSVDLDALSQRILGAGCVYFCAWGSGCERMHDFVDEAIVIRELEGHAPSNIMTTWHSADSLEEAVEFAVVSAEPDDHVRSTLNCNID